MPFSQAWLHASLESLTGLPGDRSKMYADDPEGTGYRAFMMAASDSDAAVTRLRRKGTSSPLASSTCPQ